VRPSSSTLKRHLTHVAGVAIGLFIEGTLSAILGQERSRSVSVSTSPPHCVANVHGKYILQQPPAAIAVDLQLEESLTPGTQSMLKFCKLRLDDFISRSEVGDECRSPKMDGL